MSADLEAIKARWAEVSYRPQDVWETYALPEPSQMIGIGIKHDEQGHLAEVVRWMPELAEAIIHARADIAALVAEVERLRSLVAAMERAFDPWADRTGEVQR